LFATALLFEALHAAGNFFLAFAVGFRFLSDPRFSRTGPLARIGVHVSTRLLDETPLADVAAKMLEEARQSGPPASGEQTAEAFEATVRNLLHHIRADCLDTMGRLEESLADHDSLVAYYNQSVVAGRLDLQPDLAGCLMNRGTVLYRLGRLPAAEADSTRAIEIYDQVMAQERSPKLNDDLAACYVSRGNFRRDAGRPAEALADYDAALQIRARLAEEDGSWERRFALARSYTNRGGAYLRLDRFEAALADSDRSVSLYRDLVKEHGGETLENELAGLLMNRGLALSSRAYDRLEVDLLDRALKDFDQAISIRERLVAAHQGDWSLENDLATAYANRSDVLAHYPGRQDEAASDAGRAITIRESLVAQGRHELEWNLAGDFVHRGFVHLMAGKPVEARVDNERAAAIYRRLKAGGRRDARLSLVRALSGLASSHCMAGDWAAAAAAFEEGALLIDGAVLSGVTERERRMVLREFADVFGGLGSALARLAEDPSQGQTYAAKAAYWAERGRARNLADTMAVAEQAPRRVDGAEYRAYRADLARNRELDNQLVSLERAPELAASVAPERDSHDRQVSALRAESDEIVHRIGQARLRFAAIDPDWIAGASPLSVDDIRSVARRAGAALLSLRPTRWGTSAVIVLPDGRFAARLLREPTILQLVDFNEDKATGEYSGWITAYHEAYRHYRQTLGSGLPYFREHWMRTLDATLERLGTRLWLPLRQWLDELYPPGPDSDPRRPLIVLSGPFLSGLPMHATWWSDGGVRHWACDDYQISYAPSLGVLARCLDRRLHLRTAALGLLAVRNPTGDLRYANWEVDEVARLFPASSRVVLGAASDPPLPPATRERLCFELPRHSVALISSHGTFDSRDPWARSGIATAAAPSAGHAPPLLTLGDISSLDLSGVGLLVLSACESALSELNDPAGEQLGLPSALLAAGGTAVIGSYWPVEDRSTSLLIRQLFRELYGPDSAPGTSIACALWRAQRWLRRLTRSESTALLAEEHAAGQPEVQATQQREGELARVLATLPAPLRAAAESRLSKPPKLQQLEGAETSWTSPHPFEHPYAWSAFGCFGADTDTQE